MFAMGKYRLVRDRDISLDVSKSRGARFFKSVKNWKSFLRKYFDGLPKLVALYPKSMLFFLILIVVASGSQLFYRQKIDNKPSHPIQSKLFQKIIAGLEPHNPFDLGRLKSRMNVPLSSSKPKIEAPKPWRKVKEVDIEEIEHFDRKKREAEELTKSTTTDFTTTTEYTFEYQSLMPGGMEFTPTEAILPKLTPTTEEVPPENETAKPETTEKKTGFLDYINMLTVILGALILVTVIGNVFVIAAILIEKNLQNVANYLIVSLAFADLMVACLVMPLGAVYEISEGWVLGPELCDMWTASDVLCCTASILHLVAIALDRYWAITDVEYVTQRSSRRIVTMIISIWTLSLIVSIAPHFGWKDPDHLKRITEQKVCTVSQDVSYQIFATCSTFYVPLSAILCLYWKIFIVARNRIHRRAMRNPAYVAPKKAPKKRFNIFRKKASANDVESGVTNIALMELPSSCSAAESSNDQRGAESDAGNPDHISVDRAGPSTSKSVSGLIAKQIQKVKLKRDKKQSLEAKREKKAAKTLAIITGAFVFCWLPFFVMALLIPLQPRLYVPRYVSSFSMWLGYFNSTLNPVIYTIFSPEFRQAFNRILCGIGQARWFRGRW